MATILAIGPGSDGDARRWPKHSMTRNDDYYLNKVAALWAKDLGHLTPLACRLNQLPAGYAGFERQRTGSAHVDRYIYGHTKGVFRSLNEFYPHFKWLMDNGSAVGCTCKHCSSTPRQQGPSRGAPKPAKASTTRAPAREAVSKTQPPVRNGKVDEEDTPDVYRILLDKLKERGPEGVNEKLEESSSPDWQAGHAMLTALLQEWQELPGYVPRQGELVLFVRSLGPNESLGFDSSTQTFRVIDIASKSWVDRPKWEAGVVTQTPTEPITTQDLQATPEDKHTSIANSGFRIEPMSMANGVNKTYTKQHKYVPLHAIRPLAFYKECLNGLEDQQWHPTVRHALAVSSTFCVIGKHHFKGTWPEATVFARGVFLGPELVLVGDAVRLQPRASDQPSDAVTDILIVTGIRLRFVNLDEAGDNDYDEGHPYNTCLHISGRAYTLDPSRSFDGIGKRRVAEQSETLPPSIQELGPWYYMVDPDNREARVEVPYTRVVGRCYENDALKAWFTTPKELTVPSSFQAVNSKPTIITTSADTNGNISRGLQGILDARAYSRKHDTRIDSLAGKSWFWADTRVQQLDLHEVNGRFVGAREENRGPAKLELWRNALKVLDANKRALEEQEEARAERKEEVSKSLTASAPRETAARADVEQAEQDDGDAMDVDRAGDGTSQQTSRRGMAPTDVDMGDDGEDEDAEGVLARFKAPAAPAKGTASAVDDEDDDEDDEDDDDDDAMGAS